MNVQRAKEICELPELVKVSLNGVPIYIQHVDDRSETARIYPLNDPQNEQEVSFDSLREH
ncbi:H-type small acid-soluble spore protein [Bacillus marasmi]|uniref:H-type small acid-soluble spore protein n=1 Tax=Bacillus marasmi TaxID=1926279 RepID=UPI0011C96910|nr:H-type small acid-soluble spore protein [Bacillus marasmi]